MLGLGEEPGTARAVEGLLGEHQKWSIFLEESLLILWIFCIFLHLFTYYFLPSSTQEREQQQTTPNKPNRYSPSTFLTSILSPFYRSCLSYLIKGHLFRSFKNDKWLIWLFTLYAAGTERLNDNNIGRQEVTPYSMNLFLFLTCWLTPSKPPRVHVTRTAN